MKNIDIDKDRLMPDFDAVKVCGRIINSITQYFDSCKPDGKAVIGISGGKDSTIVAMLCTLALGKDRVVGVLMPNGEQKDINDSLTVVKELGIDYSIRNISKMCEDEINYMIHENDGKPLPGWVTDNIPPRVRMTHLYAVAALKGGLVMNTCNLSEDWVGYSTKYGDSAGDFAPLANLTVGEVILVGQYVADVLKRKALADLCFKTPSDGLCGKTDEDNLGFTYATLDKYLRTGICKDASIKANIDKRHKNNLHKVSKMPSFKYGEIAYEAYGETYYYEGR